MIRRKRVLVYREFAAWFMLLKFVNWIIEVFELIIVVFYLVYLQNIYVYRIFHDFLLLSRSRDVKTLCFMSRLSV